MDSAEYSDISAKSTVSTFGSPPLMHESKRLRSVGSTSHSPVHRAEYLRVSEQRAGFFTQGFNVFSTILSYFLRFCNGGYRPYIKQAERDIDRVADFVEEGARLVVKLADEIEAMAHVAELTAQEAEDLALKVEAKTQIVKQTLDAIADVLEGDKKLSTVLTDYATFKKEAAVRETTAQVS